MENEKNELQKAMDEGELVVTGAELAITAKIEGFEYETVLEVTDDLTELDVENIEKRVIQGFVELHKKRKADGSLYEKIEETEID